ncbi:class I SAM-dependent methyltransferase [Roseomonas sp. CAU 1739]|uniref:class I SAM-dependent methyltransferase n=1 Tax=Roseomonas sp. CAU 1739 TaxID=3140364 RepID=UPI00325C1E68
MLAAPESQAILVAPGFPLPDRTALRRVGSTDARDFLETGLLLRAALEETAGLEPDHAVLDIGCGWGRLAMPLAARLGTHGRYLGMDAAAEAIAWCRRHIGEIDPRFRFHHADIRNSYANPRGRIPAHKAMLLPWEERFDRVVAFSLFTHLLPDALVRYFAEAARLCRPGGALVATFFLLDAPAREAIAAGRADRDFPAVHGIARLANPGVPEDAVAYDAAEILGLLDAAGFDAEWRPGAWCARGVDPFDYQDLVIARRRGPAAPCIGTRGAVQAISGGALRGWAWDAIKDAPPLLRLEVAGEVVAEGQPDHPVRSAPPDGPPAGAPAGFALPLPPHLVGRRLRDVRLLGGAEALPLLARPTLLLADPPEELARGWRREALRDGLWRIDSVERQPDGGARVCIWAVPPRGTPPIMSPVVLHGAARVPLVPMDGSDTALDAALGHPPGTIRPGYEFHLSPASAAHANVLRLGFAADRVWAPHAGLALPPAGNAVTGASCLRGVTGRSPASFGPQLDLRPTGLAEVPAGEARLVTALDGIDAAEEAALVDALAAAMAPGGLLLFGTPGAAALIGGAGGVARLLGWQRHGTAEAPEAAPGQRRLRSRAQFESAWGQAFALLDLREAVLSGMCDLALLKRR